MLRILLESVRQEHASHASLEKIFQPRCAENERVLWPWPLRMLVVRWYNTG